MEMCQKLFGGNSIYDVECHVPFSRILLWSPGTEPVKKKHMKGTDMIAIYNGSNRKVHMLESITSNSHYTATTIILQFLLRIITNYLQEEERRH